VYRASCQSIELAVVVGQESVENQLPLIGTTPIPVDVEEGGEERRRRRRRFVFSGFDVEIVSGLQEVFAGDAEFACCRYQLVSSFFFLFLLP
jgi:hypothetical protein